MSEIFYQNLKSVGTSFFLVASSASSQRDIAALRNSAERHLCEPYSFGRKGARRINLETPDLITIGADVGGKDAHEATRDYVLSFRKLLQKKCKGPYGATVKEFALVLRIDGSVQAWGRRGAENAAFQRKNTFATVDIFIPMTEWAGRDAVHIRKALVDGVTQAIETLGDLAERKKIDIGIDSLRRDVSAASRDFLA